MNIHLNLSLQNAFIAFWIYSNEGNEKHIDLFYIEYKYLQAIME